MSNSSEIINLNTAAFVADATGTDIVVTRGRKYIFFAEATSWGSGTLTLYMRTPQGAYIAIPNAAAAHVNFISGVLYLNAGAYRVVLAGSTSPTGVFGYLASVE